MKEYALTPLEIANGEHNALAGAKLFLDVRLKAQRIEADGYAWLDYDINTDSFRWRFKEKRWASGGTKGTIPKETRDTFICCNPEVFEMVHGINLPDGETIEQEISRAKKILKETT